MTTICTKLVFLNQGRRLPRDIVIFTVGMETCHRKLSGRCGHPLSSSWSRFLPPQAFGHLRYLKGCLVVFYVDASPTKRFQGLFLISFAMFFTTIAIKFLLFFCDLYCSNHDYSLRPFCCTYQ